MTGVPDKNVNVNPSQPSAEAAAPAPARVLLVDDNPSILLTLALVLRKNGFDVDVYKRQGKLLPRRPAQ